MLTDAEREDVARAKDLAGAVRALAEDKTATMKESLQQSAYMPRPTRRRKQVSDKHDATAEAIARYVRHAYDWGRRQSDLIDLAAALRRIEEPEKPAEVLSDTAMLDAMERHKIHVTRDDDWWITNPWTDRHANLRTAIRAVIAKVAEVEKMP